MAETGFEGERGVTKHGSGGDLDTKVEHDSPGGEPKELSRGTFLNLFPMLAAALTGITAKTATEEITNQMQKPYVKGSSQIGDEPIRASVSVEPLVLRRKLEGELEQYLESPDAKEHVAVLSYLTAAMIRGGAEGLPVMDELRDHLLGIAIMLEEHMSSDDPGEDEPPADPFTPSQNT